MGGNVQYTPQQQAAIDNRGGALLVSAAAGSGKTKVLVERLMRRVEQDHVDIDSFLIITYTRAAAGELRTKIMQEISRRIAVTPADRHLRRQLALCQKAQISTIHSFCTELIRENAQALDLSADFRVADEDEITVLQGEVLERLLDEKYGKIGQNDAFAMLVNTLGAGRDDSALIQIVLELNARLQSHAFKEQWIARQRDNVTLTGITDVSQCVYGRFLMGIYKRTAQYWLRKMTWAYEQIADDPDIMKGYGDGFLVPIEQLRRFIAACDVGWDEMLKYRELTSPRVKAVRGKEFDRVKAVRTRYNREIRSKLMEKLDGTSGELLEDMRAVAPAVNALLDLVMEFDRAFAAAKRRRNILDYSDQEHMALTLLYDEQAGTGTELAEAVSRRFTEILVDEYQDVNAVQEMIFNAVSQNGENLFMVGDVKQSIYRFRLSDPTIFLDKYGHYLPADLAEPGQERVISLSSNFRSREGILQAVNFLFSNIMSEDLGELTYSEDQALHCGASFPARDGPDVQMHLLTMENPEEEDGEEDEEEDGGTETDFEAAHVASVIADMVRSGFPVSDGAGGTRPVCYGDFAVLLRSAKDRAWKYAYAMSREGIPVAAEKQSDIISTTEVSILLSLLAVIDNPAQDIPLISVMSSPLYGFSSEELARIRAVDKKRPFYEAVRAWGETDEKCSRFIRQIGDFREASYNMPADQLIWHIFNETGMLGILGAMKGGQTRRNNLMAVYDYARGFESKGYQGLFSFMLHLRKLMESGREVVLQTSGSAENAVSIMSIHKSKGLEFPVVILPNLQKRFNTRDSSLPVLLHTQMGIGTKRTDPVRRIKYPTLAHRAISEKILDESLSEEMRVLYVAMTRAKEQLILTAVYKDAAKKLMDLSMDASLPVDPHVLRSNANYAAWILLAALNRPEFSRFRGDDSSVQSVETGKPWSVALITKNSLPPKTKGASAEQAPPADPALLRQIRENLSVNAEPRVEVPSKITATELKGRYLESETQEDADQRLQPESRKQPIFRRPDFSVREGRLTAAEKGTALHVVMQYIDYARCTELTSIREEIARMEERRFITHEQANAVKPEKILRLFQTDLGRRILNAGKVRREFKYSVLAPGRIVDPVWGEEKILFQGVVDCCLEEAECLTVIDFKTDRITLQTMAERAQAYRPQLDAYAYALERITGKPVREKYLYFFETARAVLM